MTVLPGRAGLINRDCAATTGRCPARRYCSAKLVPHDVRWPATVTCKRETCGNRLGMNTESVIGHPPPALGAGRYGGLRLIKRTPTLEARWNIGALGPCSCQHRPRHS